MRRALIGAGIGALGAILAIVSGRTEFAGRTEAATFDWRLARHTTPARPDIVIVDINEASVRALAPIVGRWPWPRMIHAGAIDYFARSRARAIVYDVQLTEPDYQGSYKIGDQIITGPESDSTFVASVRRAGNVVMLADALYAGTETESEMGKNCEKPVPSGTTYEPGPGIFHRPNVCSPFPALRDAAAALGHDLMLKDPGGVSRQMYPFVESKGVAVPSLGVAAVLMATQVPSDGVRLLGSDLRIGDAHVPLQPDGQLVLKLHGPYNYPAETYPIYSFFDVVLSEQNMIDGTAPPIPESAFTDKIVFVGTSAAAMADVHATAFGGSTPGVFLQATIADNVLSKMFIHKTSLTTDALITVGAGLIGGIVAMTLPVWWALGGLIAAAVGWIALTARAVIAGTWMPIVAPLSAVVVALVGGLAWQFFIEGREKRQVKRLFGRYVSPAVFHQLMSDPSIARLGGERREMTVLFSDIRGFTTASEKSTPEAVVAQLNEYFSAMVDVLFRHQGTLDKFVGDMVMGLFGAPVVDPRHADHAVACALEMSEELARLNARWATEGRAALDIGIGINSGEMIAGNIGSESIMSYTVIGDAVNLGSRIESLNKDYGTRILISQATKDRLTLDLTTRMVGSVAVKGRREETVVFEVVAAKHAGGRE